MKRIPPETDRLMWLVAESRDMKAVSDFEARFPELRNELSTRVNAVRSLRQGQSSHVRQIPRFSPRKPPIQPWYMKRQIAIVAPFALAAVAIASYGLTKSLTAPPAKPPVVQVVDTTPVIPQPQPPAYVRTPSEGEGAIVREPDHDNRGVAPAPAPASDDPLQRPVVLRIDHAPLDAALIMICRYAGIKAELAPGMPRNEIAIDYDGEPIAQVLDELGREYKFTALRQERGAVLIVPVRPDDEQPANQPANSQEAQG